MDVQKILLLICPGFPIVGIILMSFFVDWLGGKALDNFWGRLRERPTIKKLIVVLSGKHARLAALSYVFYAVALIMLYGYQFEAEKTEISEAAQQLNASQTAVSMLAGTVMPPTPDEDDVPPSPEPTLEFGGNCISDQWFLANEFEEDSLIGGCWDLPHTGISAVNSDLHIARTEGEPIEKPAYLGIYRQLSRVTSLSFTFQINELSTEVEDYYSRFLFGLAVEGDEFERSGALLLFRAANKEDGITAYFVQSVGEESPETEIDIDIEYGKQYNVSIALDTGIATITIDDPTNNTDPPSQEFDVTPDLAFYIAYRILDDSKITVKISNLRFP